jgi:hypothetical protein
MSARSTTIARVAQWDALFIALAALHGVALVTSPSIPVIAFGMWWNSNTISHNFIHRPFLRARSLNLLFSAYSTLLLGIPQRLWRDRHLAHHAGIQWQPRLSPQLAAESLSHHQNDPQKLEKLTRINTLHMSLFAYYLNRLQSTEDGEGSLLDHAMLLYGSGMSNSNLHIPHKLPILVAGGREYFAGGRHLRFTDGTPVANLYLTMLNKIGVAVENIGDSTGRFEELSGV